jgi:chromosome segregation ATPase
MDVPDSTPVPLGELLLDSGSLTEDQLEDALLEQRVSRKRLGSILVSKGIISAPELTAGLVAQIGGETGSVEPARLTNASGRRPAESDGRRSVSARVFRRGKARSEAEAELRELRSTTERHLDDLTRRFEQAGLELEQARREIAARNRTIGQLESRLQASERERARLVEALHAEIQLLDSALRAVERLESAVGNGKPHVAPVSSRTGG